MEKRGKYRIDWDSRVIVLKYVRKYEEYKTWLAEERKRIMEPSPAQVDGMPHGTTPGDMTAAAWSAGANTLTVKVTNGSATKTYTVTVTKEE